MRGGRIGAAAFFVAALVAAGKSEPPVKPAGEIRPCSVSAYVIDEDPKGLNLRAEPNGKSKVLAALPRYTELEITGVQGGWLRVEGKSGWLSPMGQCSNFRTNCS